MRLLRSLVHSQKPSAKAAHHSHYSGTLNKPCEIEDFDNPAILSTIRQVHSHESGKGGPEWPRGRETRKMWEVALAILTMARHGVLRDDATVLGVGAGLELTTFYLTNFVRWVFATDLYASGDGLWTADAPPNMLSNPEALSPIPFNPRRLVVQHMDGRCLRYEDDIFDAIYSSSSIEHFGDWADVAAAAREMGRVLKPGGVLTLSTEYRIAGEGKGMPGVLMFNKDEINSLIVEPSRLVPVDEPLFSVSDQTLATVLSETEQHAYYTQLRQGKEAHWKTYPQLVLEAGGYMWASYHLALVKPLTR